MLLGIACHQEKFPPVKNPFAKTSDVLVTITKSITKMTASSYLKL